MSRRPSQTDQTIRQLAGLFFRLPRRAQIVLVVLAVVGVLAFLVLRPREGAPPVVGPPGPGGAGSYLFCFWNVENLFDDRDDRRGRIDEEYDNAFASDTELRKLKYDRISDALLKMTGGTGPGPDVITCAEVEGMRAAELLMEALNAKIADPAHRYTAVAMKDLSGGRHIAPCVITRVGVDAASIRLHGGNLRILETKLVSNGYPLTVIASHWTSQLRQDDGSHGESGRERYARTIHNLVAELTGRQPDADVLVCGDFNDTPESAPVERTLRAVGDRSRVVASGDPFLLDLMAGKSPERFGTLWYGGHPLIYDHICVSAGLLDGRGWGCDPESIAVMTEGLIRPGATRRQPWRFGDPDAKTRPADRGYADHFPVAVRLTVQPAAQP